MFGSFKSNCLGSTPTVPQHQADLPFFETRLFPLQATSFCQDKNSSGCHSSAPVAVTNEVCHYLVAKKRWHPETEGGVAPEGGTGWMLLTMEGSCLTSSKLSLRHLPSSETILC